MKRTTNAMKSFKMEKKKAFTLIELMGVLVIIGILTVILVPVINNTIKNKKQDLYKQQIELIKLSAKNLASDNEYILPEEVGEEIFITLGQLRAMGYAEETIINPLTKENFPNSMIVMVIKRELDYDYEIMDGGTVITSSGIDVTAPSKKYIKDGAMSSYIITTKTDKKEGEHSTEYYVNLGKENIDILGEASKNSDIKYKIIGSNGLYKLIVVGGEKEGYLYFKFNGVKDIDGKEIEVSEANSDVESNKKIIVDNTPPEINFTTNGTSTWSKSVKTKIQVTDNNGNDALDSSTYKYSFSTSVHQELTKSYNLTDDIVQENGDGNYYLTARACDKAGNCQTKKSNKFLVDNTAPTCNWSGENDTWTKSDVKITLSGNDDGSGMSSTSSNTWEYTSKNEEIDTANLSYTIYDNAGNETTCSKDVSIKHDTLAPTCSWTGENDTWTKEDVIITASGSDTGSGIKTNSKTWKYTSLNEEYKTAYLTYRILDNAGNGTTCSKFVNVYHDTKAPTCSWTGENDTWTKSTVTVSVSGSDFGSGMSSTNSNTWEYSSKNEEIDTANLSYKIKDNVGNETTCSKNASIKHDTLAPTCSWTGENDTWTKDDVVVTVSGSDTGSGMKTNSKTWKYTSLNEEYKTARLSYRILDNAGNGTTCTKFANIYHDTKAPTCNWIENNEWTNNKVTVSVSGNDFGSGISSPSSKNWIYDSADQEIKTANLSHTIKDNAGNETVCSKIDDEAANVYYDTKAPTKPAITLKLEEDENSDYSTGPTHNKDPWEKRKWAKKPVWTIATSTDNGSGISEYYIGHDINANAYTYSGLTWKKSINETKTEMAYLINWQGSWDFYIKSCDNVGNCNTPTEFDLHTDWVAPWVESVTNCPIEGDATKCYAFTFMDDHVPNKVTVYRAHCADYGDQNSMQSCAFATAKERVEYYKTYGKKLSKNGLTDNKAATNEFFVSQDNNFTGQLILNTEFPTNPNIHYAFIACDEARNCSKTYEYINDQIKQ